MPLLNPDEDRGDDFQPDGADAAAQAAADKAAADSKAADDAAAAAAAAKAAAAGDDKTADELADEGEETAEEKAEREAAEAQAEKDKRIRVPKWRLDEQSAKARVREQELQARIRELEKAKDPAPARKDVLGEMRTQIDSLQDKYESHVFAGEKDEARTVRKELDALRENYTDAKVTASSTATRAQTIDMLKFDAALAKVEADFPVLNPDNEEAFDEAKSDEVAELMSLYVQNGLTRQSSLEKAVKYVMGSPVQKKEAGKDNTAETLRLSREKTAREKAAAADKAQPPNTAVAGSDNDKGGQRDGAIDVMKLDQDRFTKLDDDTLARLRGDTL